MITHRRLILAMAALSLPGVVRGQGNPVGPEFRVNTYTTLSQIYPLAGRDAGGDFVVVWSSRYQEGSHYGVFGQRYGSGGTPLGPEFQVNTFTPGRQYASSLAVAPSGDFVVVWTSAGQDGFDDGVFARRFAATGAPQGPEFGVNTNIGGDQYQGAVSVDPAGNFVVVWTAFSGSNNEVAGQRYAASGAALGAEFRVNTYTTNLQRGPAVAADGTGNFVVVWFGSGPGDNVGVFGQRYDSSGGPLGAQFRVNTYTTNGQYEPAVAMDPSGNFVVVWHAFFGNEDIFAQRYASSGIPLGAEFRVNTYTTGTQQMASINADPWGNFVVVWWSRGQDGSLYGVFGQRYASAGAPLGPEFRINTFTTGHQHRPAAAVDSLGNFVIVWTSNGQDGSYSGIFGQRYAPILPVELTGFRID